MTITPEDRQRLSVTLARRLPGWETRAAIAAAAGMGQAQHSGSPVQAWEMLVDQAVEQGCLPALLRAAAEQAAGDASLARLADGAEAGELRLPTAGGSGLSYSVGIGVALLGTAAVVGILVRLAWSPAADETVPVQAAPEPAPTELTPTAEPAAAAQGDGAADAREPEGDGPTDAPHIDQPTDAPTDAPDDDPEAPQPADPSPEPAQATGADADVLCPGPPGEVVGYAYAGREAPPVVDGTWTAPGGVNVRAEYPHADNGYNARAPVVCLLPANAVVQLEADPIAVEGGAYWVPIPGGSSQAP